jgi:hypothetical protein
MSANGLAGGGTTGGDTGPGRGVQRARAQRGALADTGAPGVPAQGHVRKLLADPRPGAGARARPGTRPRHRCRHVGAGYSRA